MNKNRRGTTFENINHVLLSNLLLTVNDDFITLDRNHLTGVLVNKILVPALQNTGCELRTDNLLQSLLVDLNLFSKVEYLKNILISLKTYGSQKRCYR